MTASAGFRAAFDQMPWLSKLIVLALVGSIVALSLQLWPSWMQNPDLSHGRFMPLVFLLLLYESRRHGPLRFLRTGWKTTLAVGGLALSSIGTLVAAGLWAAVLEWNHDLVVFSMAVSAGLLLGAALIAFSDARVRLLPFNWTACTAIILWPISAPIPPGSYTRISVGLQLWISSSVVKTLNLLGVAAYQTGNIIELARTSLGVNEACSGVRSLISCLFAGFFLSATLVRHPRARFAIIVLAPPLALGMNLIRSLILALLANAGIDISDVWHDTAGLAVIGLTTLLLAGLALWLERGSDKEADKPDTVPPQRIGLPLSHVIVAAALALSASLVGFFYANSHRSHSGDVRSPDLATLLPVAPPGWQTETATDFSSYRNILLTDNLVQRAYRRGSEGHEMLISIYIAYWKPGQASVSLVASHTPDACWPGTGWVSQLDPSPNEKLRIEGRILASAESRCFDNSGYRRYVWFWHLHNGRPIPYQDPNSFKELLKIAWQYGFRHHGDQFFIRISSNRPWNETAEEPLVKQFFQAMQPLGL
ncbi:MAG: exosortase/archaeosortase family protein [Opitutaceae bacterium]|jgi:exosortase